MGVGVGVEVGGKWTGKATGLLTGLGERGGASRVVVEMLPVVMLVEERAGLAVKGRQKDAAWDSAERVEAGEEERSGDELRCVTMRLNFLRTEAHLRVLEVGEVDIAFVLLFFLLLFYEVV